MNMVIQCMYSQSLIIYTSELFTLKKISLYLKEQPSIPREVRLIIIYV